MITKSDIVARRKEKNKFNAFFCSQVLKNLRIYLDDIFEEKNKDTKTEREQKAVLRGECSDAIRLDTAWFKAWENLPSSSIEAMRPFTWLFYPPQVRVVKKEANEVKWHQDYGFVLAMGPLKVHRQIITCFVPIDDDPTNRVTLQFTQDEPDFIEHEPTSNGFAAGLEKVDFKNTFHYSLSLGDCIIFGDFVPHRTYAPPGALWQRKSFEFRAISPDDALENKDYFDIEKSIFVRKNGESQLKINK